MKTPRKYTQEVLTNCFQKELLREFSPNIEGFDWKN